MSIVLTETSAFEAFKPLADRIEAKMIETVRKTFDRWVEETGGVYKHYRYNDTSTAARDFRIISRYIRSADGFSLGAGRKVALSEEYLAKQANAIATDAVLQFVAKLIAKVGNIEMTNLRFHGGADFQIDAFTNGHDIRIEQQTVYKFTNDHKLYCQFPARIYVDGKFTPAAKFEAAVA